jgi:hypothetical protein
MVSADTYSEPVINKPVPRSTTAKLCAIRHKKLELLAENSFQVAKHGSETDGTSTDANLVPLALPSVEPSEGLFIHLFVGIRSHEHFSAHAAWWTNR